MTRRQVLGAGAVLTATSLVVAAPAAASSPPTGTAETVDLDVITALTFFSAGYTRQNTWLLANVLDLPAADVVPELTLTFDNRLFALSSALIVHAGGTPLAVRPSSTTVTGPTTVVTYRLSDVVRRPTDLRVLTPLSALPLYPVDNVEDAVVPVVGVGGPAAAGTAPVPLITSTQVDGVQPWVAVVSPSWDAVSTSADTSVVYRAPVVVRVVSGGPAPVPEGFALRIETDAALCGDPVVAACVDAKGAALPEGAASIRSTTEGLVRSSRLVLADELAVGDERQVTLGWEPVELAAGAAGGVTSRVAVESRGSTSRPRRSRGGEDLQVDAWTGGPGAVDVAKELG